MYVTNHCVTNHSRTSLVVQWLRFWAANARGTGSIPGQGTKIPYAAWGDKMKTTTKRPCCIALSLGCWPKDFPHGSCGMLATGISKTNVPRNLFSVPEGRAGLSSKSRWESGIEIYKTVANIQFTNHSVYYTQLQSRDKRVMNHSREKLEKEASQHEQRLWSQGSRSQDKTWMGSCLLLQQGLWQCPKQLEQFSTVWSRFLQGRVFKVIGHSGLLRSSS